MATKEWRKAANKAIDDGPRGHHARCAEHAGCSPGTLTQLLNGDIGNSIYIGRISDFLKIPRPEQVSFDEQEREANELFHQADEKERMAILEMMRLIVHNRLH